MPVDPPCNPTLHKPKLLTRNGASIMLAALLQEAQRRLRTAHNRRWFLRTMRGAASLGLASSVRSFGRTHALRLSGTLAIPQGPGGRDRLQPDWYRKKIAQVQAEMAKDKLDALVLLNAHNII